MRTAPSLLSSGWLLLVFTSSLLVGIPMPPAHAQESEEAIVRGFITDRTDGAPLAQANVILRDSSRIVQAAVSDSDGFYQLTSIPPGTYTFAVRFLGFETYRDTLRFRPGTRTLSVSLQPAPQQLDEITVEAQEDEIEDAQAGLQRIRPADIETLPTPGPGSDLAMYLRSLPSVTSVGDRGGRLFVRGGTPSQNLILVDGTPIKKPFHIIGFYSAFPSDIISNANFYAGGFGARYLGRLSSVLDVNLRPGNLKDYQGRVEVGPFVTSLRAEGPLDYGDKSLLVNYRQSVIEWTGSELLGQSTPYRFYDLMTRLHTQGDKSQCAFTGLRTYDRGRIDPERPSSYRWSNTSVGGKCLAFGSGSSQRVYVSFGTTHFSNSVRTPDQDNRSSGTWDTHATLRVEQPYSWGRVRGGFWGRSMQFDYDFQGTFLGVQADENFDISAGAFLGAEWNMGPTVTVSPSVGTQFPIFWGSNTIEPRLRLSWKPTWADRTKITAAGGLYRQLTDAVTDERDAGSPFIAWLQTPQNKALQSTHAIVGLDHQLTPNTRLSIEGYHKTFRDLPVSEWSTLAVFNTSLALADGTAYGGSASVQFQTDRINLRANYGLGWVEYESGRDDLNAWVDESPVAYNPPHDQRHKVGLTAALDLNLFSVSARWQYSSGRPFTQGYGTDNFLEIRGLRGRPRTERGSNRLLYDRQYNARLPSYHRLDLSVKREFSLSPTLTLTTEGGAINAYDRQNLFYLDLLTRERVDQLPIIPFVGFTLDIE
ncbi:MAG: TonB-dependent receptor [Salinibacter sp.]